MKFIREKLFTHIYSYSYISYIVRLWKETSWKWMSLNQHHLGANAICEVDENYFLQTVLSANSMTTIYIVG